MKLKNRLSIGYLICENRELKKIISEYKDLEQMSYDLFNIKTAEKIARFNAAVKSCNTKVEYFKTCYEIASSNERLI